ncbi:acriflavine resistance protein B [Niastella yeongjuensis]|uniref:Acriflavine resistance protein B n=1 Tax=Niastella yeongjuensis TaxID=354355 RepID=A0A1V9F1C0_9BACT|nr:CusA/CzcA family heavy metal efflux RND transporter [Niastella yeongjuensis]OQP52062.1 acriflavine resistance protein B [Niastella yeongjuensis]SEP37103.1 cobalt-zinc-cadmium resistance protein CzcA [Niastella yeongjuensis]
MIQAIIRFSIKNKLVIGLFVLTLLLWGTYAVTKLPIDAVPDITDNQVQVITTSPSLGAPDVERLITFPIEQANSTIPGLKEIRSISRFGLSVVTIVFNEEADVYWARQQIAERLQQVQSLIPPQLGKPELAPVTTGLGEIYQYVVRPKKGYEQKYDAMQLRTMQDWIIRRQLLGTPGVAEVSSFGGRLKQYEIAVNTSRLKSHNLTIDDVFTALEKNNQNTGGAYIEKGPMVLFIRSEGLITNEQDIGNIVVKTMDAGIPVLMRDVAAISLGNATRYGAMTYNDKGEVAGAVVMMLKGGNSSAVIKRVKDKVAQIQQTLPEGVVIEPFLDRTKMVNHAIGTVQKNLIEGALIVVFVLVVFLGNLRAGLVVASVIPLSMLFAIILMNVFGVSGNLMSLGAIDFGLIVDGAVIIVEAVMHRLSHSKHFSSINKLTQSSMDDEVQHSASKMMNAAIFGQIIILVVYLPIYSLQGIEGKMFRPMAQTVTFALLGAFLLSFTYVPMITSLFISKKLSHKKTFSDRMMERFERAYQFVLERMLRFPKLIIGGSIVAFVISLFIFSRLGGEFIPKLEEGDFAIETRLLTGSNINASVHTLTQAARILKSRFPEVQKVVGKNGSSEIPTDPMPIDASDLIVILKDKKEWTSAHTFDELTEKMQQALQEIPGATFGFQYPVQMRFNELISGARQDVVCKIFGEDLDTLAQYANKVGAIINTVKGAADTYIETVTGMPQILVTYNRTAIAHYGLNIEDINRVLNTAFAGQSAGLVYEGERRFDLVVRLENLQRQDVSDVQNLLIPTATGAQIPLSQVAAVEIKDGPNQIQREDAKRRIITGFNVRGRDVESVVTELDKKIKQQVQLKSGYYIVYGGQFQNLTEARKRLSIAVPVALLLILVMLYFAFGKVKYGLLIFSAIPLSAIGGILFLWMRGMPFSISAGIGFIALFGVAVLNGIVLIAEFIRLKQHGIQDIKQIIMEGTRIRLRPVLMTASVASLGFLPMALSEGAGAEVQRPLATVVIGGLLTATFLTLVVLPVLYLWVENRKRIKPALQVAGMIIALLVCQSAFTQTGTERSMPLEQMLQQASTNNLSLKASRSGIGYWKQLQTATTELPRTQIGGEYGGINSMNNDTRFYINQSFELPVVYRRQKELYGALEQVASTQVALKQQELQKAVKTVFYNMVDLLERQKLLLRLDSIYSRFLDAANLRLKTGESTILEKSNAETQIQQLKLQQEQVKADLRMDQQQLQWLLNTKDLLLPEYHALKKEQDQLIDTLAVISHPAVQLQQQQVKVNAAQTNIEKARLNPEFTVGYSNQSIIGYQTKDGVNQKYYSGGDRFNIYQLSVGLPIFNKAVKARIRAGQLQEATTRLEVDATSQYLTNQWEQLQEAYKKYGAQVQYYETAGLQQAALITRNARLGFEKGDVSYVEWTLQMNNAVNIELGYLQAIHALNNTIIELEYLTGK